MEIFRMDGTIVVLDHQNQISQLTKMTGKIKKDRHR